MAECSFLNYSALVLVAQLCLTLCNPMDCSLPGSSVHGIFQARILEWAVMPSSRGSSWLRDRTQVCITGRFFTVWATREDNVNFPSLFHWGTKLNGVYKSIQYSGWSVPTGSQFTSSTLNSWGSIWGMVMLLNLKQKTLTQTCNIYTPWNTHSCRHLTDADFRTVSRKPIKHC